MLLSKPEYAYETAELRTTSALNSSVNIKRGCATRSLIARSSLAELRAISSGDCGPRRRVGMLNRQHEVTFSPARGDRRNPGER
jgi:hypothetical protein